MPIINSYPTITPKGEDLVLISDISEDGNPTKTASVNSILALAPGGGGGGSISTIQSQDTTYLSVTNASGPVTTLAVNITNISSFVVSSKNLPQVEVGSGTAGSVPLFATAVAGIAQLEDSAISQDVNGNISITGGNITLTPAANAILTLGNSANSGSSISTDIPFQFRGKLLDTAGNAGSSGAILTSTTTGVEWAASTKMQNWIIQPDDTAVTSTISSGETVQFAGDGKIDTKLSTSPTVLEIIHTGSQPTSATASATTGTRFSFIDSITCDSTGHVTEIKTRQQTVPQEPFLVYSALLTQSSTDKPTANVLHNTIPGTLNWTRSAPGQYTVTSSGTPFTTSKVQVFINNGNPGGTTSMIKWTQATTSAINITTVNLAGTNADDLLRDGSIEIRIYS